MELNHAVAVEMGVMPEKTLCAGEQNPEPKGSQCRIGKDGSPGDLPVPTPERLYGNMKEAEMVLPEEPPRMDNKPDGRWDLHQCNAGRHPFQSHHLIPKMHLPDHDVCVWLAKNAANSEWELVKSTDYDTDDYRNGLALPFASTTHQWKHGPESKDDVCIIMMRLTQKQLHQGSHTYDNYEHGEEQSLHEEEESGYLGAVDTLLKVINGQMLEHLKICSLCKKSDTKPVQVRPLKQVVAAMHQVSQLMGSMIASHTRFVSERAANYWRNPT